MGDSLQEQLRALGLAQEQPDRRAGRGRRNTKGKRRAGRSAAAASGGEPSLDEAYALREREERRAAERSRQAKLAEERRRREINQKIRRIVEDCRLNHEDASVARHFLYKERIRKVYVTVEQQRALADGEMGIVYLTGGYHLLAAEPLEQVRGISADHVVELKDSDPEEDGHPVPDDLIW